MNQLLNTRLANAIDTLRSLTITTKQEALAQIYAVLNAALVRGDRMTPLTPVLRHGPALLAPVESNLTTLNTDVQAIIDELLATEKNASALYNSFGSLVNGLRQSVREAIYASSSRLWQEQFLSDKQLAPGYTANLDYDAGVASSTLLSETFVTPIQLTSGVLSDGEMEAGSNFQNLLDGDPSTSLLWNGNTLDLLITFAAATIVNSVEIELVGYQGLMIDSFTSTPDGIYMEDLLIELPQDARNLDGNASKCSGNWFALFAPRHVKQMRIVIRDVISSDQIRLRNLKLSQRKYAASGMWVSQPITVPSGTVVFRADGQTAPNLTSIAHQLSTDGNSFVSITPGQTLSVSSPFWYRTQLTRLDANFQQASAPLSDPLYYLNALVSSFTTVELGGGIIARKAVFSSVTAGTIDLEEQPLAGTLTVYDASSRPLAAGAYSLSGSALTFTADQSDITIQYQTSAYGRAGIVARQNYYTPYLRGIRFEKAA